MALKGGILNRLLMLKKEINSLMDKEERMWRQRSRTLYLKDGDRNTRFFHCRATQRRHKNLITGIKSQSNIWCTKPNEVSNIFLEYFQQLFTSSNSSIAVSDLDSIPRIVTTEMNETLTASFQAWEVEVALKQMAPLKAPGPDGMPPLFYQNFWELVKGDVIHDILFFLNSGSLPLSLNHTFITLIPKIKNPENVTEFRPISLCNVLYKIFSKVLANRLKRVLPILSRNIKAPF